VSLLQPYLDGKTKVEIAIERIQHFSQFAGNQGYFLNFSGGKDSVVLKDLIIRAGVKFEAYYCRTGIDPPELVQFIRQYHQDVVWLKPKLSIWQGIMIHGLPTRKVRWCCELLKEYAGKGRVNLTGIRWEESAKRKARLMYEQCRNTPGKSFLHPIIDFTGEEIWEYIRNNKLSYCKLYDEGFKRLGCILCPMSSNKKRDMQRWPKISQAWYRAGERHYNAKPELVLNKYFKTFNEKWQWWLSGEGIKIADDCQGRFI